jgi:ketosteroid isomerase-like protein
MQEVDFSIDRMLANYASAVAAKDTGSFMDLYDLNVRVFDAWECWSYEGAAAWGAAVQSWFDSLGTESVRVTFDETQSSGVRELVIASSIVTYTGMSAQGRELRSMQNRMTWAIRLSTPGPRIIHEHTSAPIGFDELKAILER